jgi:hypothetical protein
MVGLCPAQVVENRDHVVDDAFDQPVLAVSDGVRSAAAPRIEPNMSAARRHPFENVAVRGVARSRFARRDT